MLTARSIKSDMSYLNPVPHVGLGGGGGGQILSYFKRYGFEIGMRDPIPHGPKHGGGDSAHFL